MKRNAVALVAVLALALTHVAFAADDGSRGSDRGPLAECGHDSGSIFTAIGHGFVDGITKVPAVLELTGIRFPVKNYQEEVSCTFWRGSRLEGDDAYADLAARGFKATVDLTREGTGDAEHAPQHGLKTVNIRILDNGHPTEAQMVEFLDYVTAPQNQPVYVHCEAGVGRTSIATAVYRMAVQGWSTADALEEAKKHGMNLPNQVEFVKKFGCQLSAGKIPGHPLPAATN